MSQLRRYVRVGGLLVLLGLLVAVLLALLLGGGDGALEHWSRALCRGTPAALRPVWSPGAALAPAVNRTERPQRSRTAIEDVMGAHQSRLTREAWARRSAPPPAPVFFLTAARSWGKSSPAVEALREEQYASNLGGILALGYQVYLAVSPTGGRKWDLVEALAASAAPGQLRVHYCSNATAVARRSGGPDEILCMQEAIERLFEGCLLPWEPFTPLLPPPACCPAPDAHVIRMSGRYLMAKYHLLHAILERGSDTDAFVKWGPRWTESSAVDFPQAYTFFLAMRVRAAGAEGGGASALPSCARLQAGHLRAPLSHALARTLARTHAHLPTRWRSRTAVQGLCGLPHELAHARGRRWQARRAPLRVALQH